MELGGGEVKMALFASKLASCVLTPRSLTHNCNVFCVTNSCNSPIITLCCPTAPQVQLPGGCSQALDLRPGSRNSRSRSSPWLSVWYTKAGLHSVLHFFGLKITMQRLWEKCAGDMLNYFSFTGGCVDSCHNRV